ncbi:MAG: transglutaminase family protein [Candidatus Tectimicrobiota bacterium]
MSMINVGCELRYHVHTSSSFLFHVAAAQTAHQTVRQEHFTVTPQAPYTVDNIGSEGNRVLRLQTKAGDLTLRYEASVELAPEIEAKPSIAESEYPELPNEVLPYLNPSRYCESDRLLRLVRKEFGHLTPGYGRVVALCDWTYNNLDYIAGSTDARSSACDVLIQRAGVCRDYAHLAIALCRALCIPARYVSGYAVGLTPPDFHGFFEAFLESRWYLFDATRMAPRDGFVRIGTGRDAVDTPFATIIGAATLQQMTVSATELTDEIEAEPGNAQAAVSTV